MNWKVEKGTEADAGKIAEIQIDMALESEGAILDRDKILNGVRAGLSDPAKGTYYIVRTESGETAGSLLVTKEWSDWNNCWYWWIQSVFVKPEYRRQGLAKEMMSRYLNRECEKGRKRVILTCLDAKVRMYEKMGFHNNGVSGSAWGGEQWYEISCTLNT